MKAWMLLGLGLSLSPIRSAGSEKVVTLGDSLTFAYEAEFCFQKTHPIIGTFGDGMPATVRNWIEILSHPAWRGDRFDLGSRDSITVSLPFSAPFDLYFRQIRNWAIPGLKVDGMRRFVLGQASLIDLVSESADFATLAQLLAYSNFNSSTDFALTDFENQIRNEADRVVIFIGGNDVRGIYGTVYDGGGAGSFISEFVDDLIVVIDRIQTLKPGVPMVLVNVPHIGITPDIREPHPWDTLKTGRVTTVLQELNGRLQTLAVSRGLGFADIFTPTLRLLDPAKPLVIGGIPFPNTGTPTGDVDSVWLNGPISANFHPNTNAQTVIANGVIEAFNRRYASGIAPLNATETLNGLLGKSSAAIDLPFTAWSAAYGLAGASAANDHDGDGLSDGLEFAAGLDPTLHDSSRIQATVTGGHLELAFPQRLAASIHFTLKAESAATPAGPWSPVTPSTGTDGLFRAAIPISASPGFLRLKSNTP